ncbi:CoA-transferase family III [Fontimonas thermophila]|uniref:CoA-transferase family III n=1 Tax=Fontimonas thermophila TaxID=1076937 RepID=A0A1I2J915_9GAMM|nr:CoA transferase [Fontimonas thermophila]SFF51014.1 CoA-transferase family III [Fontimonas thermophila]
MGTAAADEDGLSARAYAQGLLDELGVTPLRPLACTEEDPALAWARSGLMALTGRADGPPVLCPVAIPTCADGALAALASLAPDGALAGLRGAALLVERAAIAGYTRHGAIAPGGGCRLLPTRDGWLALNLARTDDWSLLPAWLETEVATDWESLAAAVRTRTLHDAIERGRLLGLAVAPVVPPWRRPQPWFQRMVPGGTGRKPRGRRPRVVDLSSLWAGPLATHLLQHCGAEVIKVESLTRPDGARGGPPAFFDLLNAGKHSVALDFGSARDRARLRTLLEHADIVIEASRPRALRQLGIDAEALVRERPHLSWISLTGYGRSEPAAQWIAYGDDAATAAGLVWLMQQTTGEPLFVGDAIADPLSGMHAALAAWAGWCAGGAGLLSIALVDVVRRVVRFAAPPSAAGWRERAQRWRGRIAGEPVRAPQARRPTAAARPLGADTAHVFDARGCTC